MFVVEEDGRLVGVITRKTLVREVVAAGKHPSEVQLREIAEPPLFTLDPAMSLDDGFHQLEERDFERVPVVERAAGSSACSRARSCSAGSPRTSRRSSIRIPARCSLCNRLHCNLVAALSNLLSSRLQSSASFGRLTTATKLKLGC